MTCIVGIAKDGDVYIGADSLGSNGSHKQLYKRPKVFQNGHFIIGYTGSFRMGQLLEFSWEPPEHYRTGKLAIERDYEYMVNMVIPSIQNLFDKYNYGKKDKGEQKGGTFIIGYNGNVYAIQSDFSVLEPMGDFVCVGSGKSIALGSLASTTHWDDVEKRIKKAIDVAEAYIPSVQGPVHIKVLSGDSNV